MSRQSTPASNSDVSDKYFATIDVKSSNSKPINRFWVLPFSFAVIAFLYLRGFLLPATPFVTAGDEVHYFLHAVRMLHGQLPYRDFFTFVPPGTDLLYLGAFHLFGVHQWVVQGFHIVLGFLLTWVVLWVSGSVLRGPLVILPALLFLVFDFNSVLDATHHWWSTLFVMAATGLLLNGKSDRRFFAAGALCGIATLFTQTQGGLSLFALIFFVLWADFGKEHAPRPVRKVLLLVLPFVVIVTATAGYYAYRVGPHALFYWIIYFPLVYFSTIPAHTFRAYFAEVPHFHKVSDLATMTPYLFIHLTVPFVYLFSLFRLLRERKNMGKELWEKILLLNMVGLALFITIMSAATWLRLCVVALPAIILWVWFFSRTTLMDRAMRVLLWTTGMAFLLYFPVSRQLHWHALLDLPTGRSAFISPGLYDRMRWLAERTHPGDSFFNEPMVAFDLSLESPGPLDYVHPGEFVRPEQVDVLLRSLSAHHTRYIFLYPELYAADRIRDNLDPLRQYMAMNFHLEKADSTGQIWERN